MRFAVPFLSVVVEEVRDVRHRRHGDERKIDERCELKAVLFAGDTLGIVCSGYDCLA